jgi:hypothetical protein
MELLKREKEKGKRKKAKGKSKRKAQGRRSGILHLFSDE